MCDGTDKEVFLNSLDVNGLIVEVSCPSPPVLSSHA